MFTIDVNVAATLTHDSIAGSETEATAAFIVLGCEKWFEQMRLYFFAHAAAIVGERKEDVFAGSKLSAIAGRFFTGANI